MESQSSHSCSHSIDAVGAFQGARGARAKMAARVRSPWWAHVLRGFFVASIAFGIGEVLDDLNVFLPVGIIGLVVLERWRVNKVGVSRANPERWRFLLVGAPWSIVLLLVVTAAIAFVGVDRGADTWKITTAAVVAGVVTTALGPAADHSARRRMADQFLGDSFR